MDSTTASDTLLKVFSDRAPSHPSDPLALPSLTIKLQVALLNTYYIAYFVVLIAFIIFRKALINLKTSLALFAVASHTKDNSHHVISTQ